MFRKDQTYKMFQFYLCLLLLNTYHLVSARECDDCQNYHTCQAAADHSRFKKNDETKALFQKAFCGMEMTDAGRVFKVCCSDFPSLKKIENRWSGMSKENLLPNKCGSILGNRIFGGKRAKLYEFPWMVLISYDTREGPRFECGGTIINSKYILTAAHCVVNKKIKGVRIGEYDIDKPIDCDYETHRPVCEDHIQDMFVKEIIPHENYQRDPTENDIALLRVDGDIFLNYTNVEPICLPLSTELRNEYLINGTVAGWGYSETGTVSPVLLKVDIPVKTDAECKGYYNRYNRDAVKKQFCAGELNKDSCGGDSGGPFMTTAFYNDVNSYVQYGIVSHGPAQCGSAFPGVYTDVREYVDWILEHLRE